MNNIIWQDLIDGIYYIIKKNNHSSKIVSILFYED